MLAKCRICHKTAHQKCENCCRVRYCGSQHQSEDYEKHKPFCFPARSQKFTQFERSGAVGNLIASRVIKPGEILFKEKPLLRFPNCKKIGENICLSCSSTIDGNYRCSKCNLPMCNKICQEQDAHIPECTLLKKNARHLSTYISSSSYYKSIGVIRCIYKEGSCPEKWKKIQKLTRPNIEPSAFQMDLPDMIRQLKKYYNISGYTNSDMKLVILSILYHGIELNTPSKMGIYEILNIIPQCCSPNAFLSFNENEHIVIQAAQNIEIGETVNVNYCYFYDGFDERNRYLSKQLSFTCHCIRCEDSTDLGTHHNSLVCVPCKGGLILPPTGTNIRWSCNSCGKTKPRDIVMAKLKQIEGEKDTLSGINEHEAFLIDTMKLLGENHYLRLQVKVNLLLLQFSNEWLENKITYCGEKEERGRQLCRDILKFSQAVTRNGYHPEIGAIKKILFGLLLVQVEKISKTVKETNKEENAILMEMLDITEYVRKIFRGDSLLPSERLGFDELKKTRESRWQILSKRFCHLKRAF